MLFVLTLNRRDDIIMAKYDKPLDKDDEETPAKYRLPFALCKERGIELPKWATPRDAWNALKGYNINPALEYQRLFEKKKKDKFKRAINKEKKRQARTLSTVPIIIMLLKKDMLPV